MKNNVKVEADTNDDDESDNTDSDTTIIGDLANVYVDKIAPNEAYMNEDFTYELV